MKRKHSAASHNAIVVNCALLAAAATLSWFRTSHIQFFIGLFSDFLHYNDLGKHFEMQAVQINRTLKVMEKEKLLQSKKQESKRFFKISGLGVSGILKEIAYTDRCLNQEEIMLIRYIFTTYAHTIKAYIESDGSFPSHAFEVKDLDFDAFIHRQHSMLAAAVKKMRLRAQDCEHTCKLIRKRDPESSITADFIKEFSKRFSYRLSHLKPLAELYGELPTEFVEYELRVGFQKRQDILFENLVQHYEKLALEMESLMLNR